MSSKTTLSARAPGGAVAKLLGQHHGDRSVYLCSPRDRALLNDALLLGLVSSQGQLTSAGYTFWQRYQQD